MLKNLKTKKLILKSSNHRFNLFEDIDKDFRAASWSEICQKLFKIINDYKNQKTNS